MQQIRKKSIPATSLKFEELKLAYISTSNIREQDGKLISDTSLPWVVAETWDKAAAFFILPSSENLQDQLAEMHTVGFSKEFTNIIEELLKQKFDYVLFSTDGTTVDGLAEFDW